MLFLTKCYYLWDATYFCYKVVNPRLLCCWHSLCPCFGDNWRLLHEALTFEFKENWNEDTLNANKSITWVTLLPEEEENDQMKPLPYGSKPSSQGEIVRQCLIKDKSMACWKIHQAERQCNIKDTWGIKRKRDLWHTHADSMYLLTRAQTNKHT